MSKSRPLWPLVAAVLIGLPVLYVLSYAPAIWIRSRYDTSLAGQSFTAVYGPLSKALMDSPYSLQGPIRRFIRFGMKPDSQLLINADCSLDRYDGPPGR